ncbi:MAG: cob(I)yrinic acid a,c-diamide adenosyltransferase, partial [Deltaproteobacteria bacterium]|nr:cob(I)yrinic acid a,c-diamide adenosyltransferase [Deltaproteobacteria bacterium]
DEILDTIIFNILPEERIGELMEACRGKIELVMTGRDAPPAFIEMADYVTKFVHKKHPYYKGVRARKGFEF